MPALLRSLEMPGLQGDPSESQGEILWGSAELTSLPWLPGLLTLPTFVQQKNSNSGNTDFSQGPWTSVNYCGL